MEHYTEECIREFHSDEEANRNLALKRPVWLPRLDGIPAGVGRVPSVVFELPVRLEDKEVPVLGATIRARCTHFVTGDRRDFGHVHGRTVQGVKVIGLLRFAQLLTA